ncbi:MAG: nicotinate (nicotinamide) nucleotide adenylyltransferase [Chloroflexi bacterium]|nr:nicotinate (nicotinamide) nucleotide adenylyltransferase [Chloroflexota bacterium]
MSGIKKIGVFGGTFDPPHSGHLKIIKESLIQLGLDRLYVVVSGDPWMKRDRVVANRHQRQEMIEIALADDIYNDYKKVCLLKFEINKDSPSYSYQTLEYLKGQGNINDFYFIVGSDAALTMDKWKRPLNILSFSKIVCVPRDGISNKIVKNKLLEIHPQAQIHFLKNVDEKISSTTIKGFITLGGTFDENSYLTLSTNAPLSGHLQYLNKNVYTYILKNKIYL